MKRVLHLSAVRRAVRAKVCARCERRSPDGDVGVEGARACEAGCALFQNLPRLWNLAVRIDPMVGRFAPAMNRAIRETQGRSGGGTAAASGSGRAMAEALRELSGK